MVVFYAVATIVFYLFLLSACAAPSTQERTVRQGSQQVEKVCTEKPSGYSDTFEKQLKVKLPLGTATEPQAEGVLRRYIEQEPKGTPRGEDLSSYLFYICQMSNNGGFTPETTERLINIFLERWSAPSSRTDSEIDRVSRLAIEAVNDRFSQIPQENQPRPPRVKEFSRVRVSNVGQYPIKNIRMTLLGLDGKPGRFSLPVASVDNLFQHSSHPSLFLSPLSADLNPGEDREFEAVVECNGIDPWKCPSGQLAIFGVDNGKILFIHSLKDCKDKHCISLLDEFTVRASGDGATSVTKTFLVARDDERRIVLKEKPEK